MRRWWITVGLLCHKEALSLRRDGVLLGLIVFAFTAAILIVANGVKAEVSHATIAFIDEDRSTLSRQLREGVQEPYFQTPVLVDRGTARDRLDRGTLIFVVDVPPRFEADLLAGRMPSLDVQVDATAMTQAGLGVVYLQDIFLRRIAEAMPRPVAGPALPFHLVPRIRFNPNSESAWFTSVMQIVTNVTVLSIILVGAAVIREREHGTIEHLLVLPVSAGEIAVAKIVANALVIFVASLLSLLLVVHVWLGVPLAGSLSLFALCLFAYVIAVSALGMMLATIAPAMPQFGLLAVPVYAVAYLLSGAATPVANMPTLLQAVIGVLPTTQFVSLTQSILYRGAGLETVWLPLLVIVVSAVLFLLTALVRFRSMLARQG
ncbi:ABC transporter permease [Gluconacetobacter sp. Hr-1-5]|uniref:ABC transporter permease n=1 Tax=Gluconacetobacter sp. Hr-1-5 TaxID=3395370 RepID=UPI003B51B47E